MYLNRIDHESAKETIYRVPLWIGRIIARILNSIEASEYVEWFAHNPNDPSTQYPEG